MKRLSALVAGFVLVFSVEPTAFAQQTPPPAGARVALPPAKLAVGEVRRYRVETSNVIENAGSTETQSDVQVIDITVQSVDGARVVMSSTPVSMEGVPPVFAEAYVGRRMDYVAAPSGMPTAIVDWPALQSALVARYRAHPDDPSAVAQAAGTERLTEAQAIEAVFVEPAVIGSMQSWGNIAAEQAGEQTTGSGESEARILAMRQVQWGDPTARTLGIRRVVALDPESPAAISRKREESLVVAAVLSMEDGWVVTAQEVRRVGEGDRRTTTTRRFTRVPVAN